MKKVTTLVLMLCLVLSGALCYANGEAGTGNGKDGGIPIEVKELAVASSGDKSATINASINGHTLTVVFSENLGQVAVEITTASGETVDCSLALTPNGILFYIPNTGEYIINITLPNGDEYYGEFEVTD